MKKTEKNLAKTKNRKNFPPLQEEYKLELIANRLLETIILSLREAGAKEHKIEKSNYDEDSRVTLAKQYINDNIEFNLKISDVAAHCYLSTKQLTRIFNEYEDTPPGEYINKKRIELAQKYLNKDSYSIKQISELLNFTNEYYFNSFFKKHTGLPPGKYRKMIGK